ncbi:DHA2 family efflux MFS transporter permease subunit [Secundilactobacillus paracollinoides]|uniref:EmrB/QacA family drug resistance transporter n=1 Tax=Secundilactobacillus paracollinoides TaxID=240427 RepID=A0A1B2IYA3_9LACO|nr:DHA2 family efflux MFS transporter permease subunit [Secundilactobacillus paracollinoides]ANZ67032.1 EmrB/QacA family drug resistance transporter [Secundilactobacillus paracollinoides]
MTKQIKSPFMVVLGVLVINFLGLFSETALNIALPQIGKSFNVSSGQTQWLILGYTMVIGIVLPLTTLISRWVKAKIILAVASVIFILGSVIAALAPSFTWLFIGRTIQGISTGLFMPLLFAVTLLVYPSDKLGSAMGIIAVVMNFAPAIGPSLSGVIVNYLSWRWIFIIFVPISIIALILILMTVPDVIKQTKPKVDLLSVLYSILGFGLLITAVGMFSNFGFENVGLYVLLIVSIIFVIIYVRRQLRIATPVLNFRIFKSRKYTIAAIIAGLNFAMVMAAMYIIPQMLQSGLRFSVSEAGLILLPAGLVNAFVSLLAGHLYDAFGAKRLVRIGAIMALIGILLLLRVTASSSLWYVIIVDIILMAGSGLLLSPAQSYGLGDLSGTDSNDGSTIINTLQQVFGALSVSIATTFLIIGQHASTSTNAATTYMSGAHMSFLWVTVLMICLTFFAFKIVAEKKD